MKCDFCYINLPVISVIWKTEAESWENQALGNLMTPCLEIKSMGSGFSSVVKVLSRTCETLGSMSHTTEEPATFELPLLLAPFPCCVGTFSSEEFGTPLTVTSFTWRPSLANLWGESQETDSSISSEDAVISPSPFKEPVSRLRTHGLAFFRQWLLISVSLVSDEKS